MISALRGYDAWLTRTPWDDMPDFIVPPKCSVCGIFMQDKALHCVTVDEGDWCSGKPPQVEVTFTERDAGILDIIGWDKLGTSYMETYLTLCGEEKEHEPHFAVMSGYMVIYRRCSRGHLSKEFVV